MNDNDADFGPFTTGQPVENKRSGVCSWVLVPGALWMTIVTDRNQRFSVHTENYREAPPGVPWSSNPTPNYGAPRGGWSE